MVGICLTPYSYHYYYAIGTELQCIRIHSGGAAEPFEHEKGHNIGDPDRFRHHAAIVEQLGGEHDAGMIGDRQVRAGNLQGRGLARAWQLDEACVMRRLGIAEQVDDDRDDIVAPCSASKIVPWVTVAMGYSLPCSICQRCVAGSQRVSGGDSAARMGSRKPATIA